MGDMLQLFLPLSSKFLQTRNCLNYHRSSCAGSVTPGCYAGSPNSLWSDKPEPSVQTELEHIALDTINVADPLSETRADIGSRVLNTLLCVQQLDCVVAICCTQKSVVSTLLPVFAQVSDRGPTIVKLVLLVHELTCMPLTWFVLHMPHAEVRFDGPICT